MPALPSLNEQLSQLIATPSVSSTCPAHDMGNRPVIDKLAGWLEELGFSIDIQALPHHPQKANLIATLGKGPGGLVFSGHTDTVPYDDSRWQSDPFTLSERDHRFYGLGSSDMKGFFALAIEAIRQYRDRDFKQPLILLATADEESSMEGARQLAAAGKPKARYAIVGEPTGLKPIRMHKGMMMERLSLTGSAGHSSNPALGNNAIEAMHSVIADLMQFRAEMQEKYTHPGFAVPVPTLNLGCIHGGDNPNRICGHSELQFDLRLLPGMDNDDMRAQLRHRLQASAEPLGVEFNMDSLMPGVNAYEELADSEFVQSVESLTGHTAESVAFATEAPFLQQMGMQTIVMGPGSIDQAHQPDEFLAQDQIVPCVQLLCALIERYCLK